MSATATRVAKTETRTGSQARPATRAQRHAADLNRAFAALSDPTRRAMLARLARGEATVGELAEPFDLTHQAISRHVGILREAGLITQRVDGQRRPCRLDVERMQLVSAWVLQQQEEWRSRVDRLEGHVAQVRRERSR